MSAVWLPNQKVFCPLCDEPFKKRKILLKGKVILAYFCVPDNVMIFDFDPMFNKWRDTDKIIKCPGCKAVMKWFSRMIDCYIKMECPECGICVEKDSDMAIDPTRGVEVEDMHQPEPEVFDVEIPIDKLNLTPEKKVKLQKKIKEKRERDGK